MYKLTLQNESGTQLTFNQLGGAYTISDISGLNPPPAVINTNASALVDGATYNSAKVEMRSINIAFAIEYEAEKNRLQVYDVLRIKKPITLFYKSAMRDVFIQGYVQSLEVTHMEMKQVATVAILCPSPFFKAAQEVVNDLEQIISAFHFPFSSEGGKNLLVYPYYYTSRTANGIKYTDNGDGSITCDGTSTSSSATAFVCQSRDYSNFRLAPGNYILSGGIDADRRVLINYMAAGASSATTVAVSTGEDAAFTITEELSQVDLQVGIYTAVGGSWDNVTVYPMIRFATYESDEWQPYEYGQIVFGYIDPQNSVSIINSGNIAAGMTLELYARGAVTNPKIYNYITGEYIGLDFSLETADLISITTERGNKTITLLRNGTTSNLFNYLSEGSTWLQLEPGENEFVYTADAGSTALSVKISHYDLYEGV